MACANYLFLTAVFTTWTVLGEQIIGPQNIGMNIFHRNRMGGDDFDNAGELNWGTQDFSEQQRPMSYTESWMNVCLHDCRSIQQLLNFKQCQGCCQRYVGFTAYPCMAIAFYVQKKFVQSNNNNNNNGGQYGFNI